MDPFVLPELQPPLSCNGHLSRNSPLKGNIILWQFMDLLLYFSALLLVLGIYFPKSLSIPTLLELLQLATGPFTTHSLLSWSHGSVYAQKNRLVFN